MTSGAPRFTTPLIALLCVLLGTPARVAASEVPSGGHALEAWLQAGHYRQWRGESKVHSSQGPHFGKVRAWLNPVLFDSLNNGNKDHPQGAVAVKELYGEGDRVLGWSVAIKTEATSAVGANWYWYEKFEARVVADGKGVLLCRSCHLTGRDYVLTPWPLR
jgi:hypothetical protein